MVCNGLEGCVEGETSNSPAVDSAAIEVDLAKESYLLIQHFFVNVDAHLDVDDEAVGLDHEVSQPQSITCFLILPYRSHIAYPQVHASPFPHPHFPCNCQAIFSTLHRPAFL
jgi:hypothetical protein